MITSVKDVPNEQLSCLGNKIVPIFFEHLKWLHHWKNKMASYRMILFSLGQVCLYMYHLCLVWPPTDDGVAEQGDHHDEEEITGVHQVEIDHRTVMLKHVTTSISLPAILFNVNTADGRNTNYILYWKYWSILNTESDNTPSDIGMGHVQN